jgi:hypothetical protein
MAPEIVASAARRVRRPGWRDPRLGMGVLLVVCSVALGAWTLGRAEDGIPVYVAGDVLTPGEPVTVARLTVTTTSVPGDLYLRADAPLPADAVATRLVGAGELVPARAVGSPKDVEVRPVAVTVDGALSASVTEGALVDLWLTEARPPAGGGGERTEPALVAGGLRVAGVREDDSLFAGAERMSVELLVPDAQVKAVLAAVAEEGTLTLVPLPGRS